MAFQISSGVVAAILTVAAMGASLAGKSQLAAFLGSPDAATAVTAIVGSVGTIVAGVMQGIKKETVVEAKAAPAPAPAAAASKLRAGKA